MWVRSWPAIGLGLLLGLPACGAGVRDEVERPSLLPEPVISAPPCTAAGITTVALDVPVPADERVSWVLRCLTQERDLPGQGRWTVTVAERADPTVRAAAALVAALRLPTEPPSTLPCPASLQLLAYFALVDATGKAVSPKVPTDGCGRPRPEVGAALGALSFRTVSVTPSRQLQSQQAMDAGCAQQWKDEFALSGNSAPAAVEPALPGAAPPSLRVCVYDRITSATVPVGQFAAGRTLTGPVLTGTLTELDRAGETLPCTLRHTRFAVLLPTSTAGSWAMVELDGCARLLRPDGTTGQLDQRTAAALGAG